MPRARKPKPSVESPSLPKTFSRDALAQTKAGRQLATGLGEWTEDAIVAARAAQVRGDFRNPVRLFRSLLTEPAIFSAALNRLAPHRGLPREVRSPKPLEGSAAAILAEAQAFTTDASVCLAPGVVFNDFERLAIHAYSVDQIHWEGREDGSRMDPFVQPWSLENVRIDPITQKPMALTTEGEIPIVHGDGRWIVSAESSAEPWRWGALVALALLWPKLSLARRDQSASAQSHGDDKWIGTLPQGIALDSEEGIALLVEMTKLYETRRAMLKPFGAEVERVEAEGTNWQIFKELLGETSRDVQRVLLGQDGTMTNSGGNYIKSWGLFGVRNDIVEADLRIIGAAYSTGLLRPWSLINFGRWDRLEYAWQMPDADADARRESIAQRRKDFNATITETRANGFLVDQAFVDALARELGIDPPTLADQTPTGAEIFGYHIDSGIVLIDEVRARMGFPPLPNGAGQVTAPQAAAQSQNTPVTQVHREPLRPAA